MWRARRVRTSFDVDQREARGAIAAALWVDSLSMGVLLGAVGGFVLVVGSEGTWSPGFLLLAAMGSIVLGGGFGFIVGQIVGLTLGLIATFSTRASRTANLRAAIPLVALTVSVTPVVLVVGKFTTPTALFTAYDVILTLSGAAWVFRRYRRLDERWERIIEAHRVH
jgi:hypothetical protein